MMRNVGSTLGLGMAGVLALCVVTGLVSYKHTEFVRHKVAEITRSGEPANATVAALETNLVETAFTALGFLSTGDSTLLDALARAGGDSQTLQEQLGEDLDGFPRFERIAREQVRLRQVHARTVRELSAILDSTAGVLTAQILTPITGKSPALARRHQAVREMDIRVNALRGMLGQFLLTGDAGFAQSVEAVDQDFQRFFRVYQDLLLDPREQAWCMRLRHHTAETVRLSRTLIGIDTHRREQVAEFLAVERTLLATLNDRTHVRTDSALARTRQEILTAGDRANATIIGVVLLGIVFSIVAGAVITKRVAGPIRELTLAMQGISRGDQMRKVIPRSSGELSSLAEAFNVMAERLLQTIERLQESETRFRTMFEDAPIGIAVSDEEGRLTQTNPALREMLGRHGRAPQ